MVQIESMCCGTPVVASDMPGVNEPVQKTGFGRLARPKDSLDLSRQIRRVLNGDYRRDGFRVEDWDTSKVTASYKDLFRELPEPHTETAVS
jgi:glycosyltransferase involved in cell wall biosynthesis